MYLLLNCSVRANIIAHATHFPHHIFRVSNILEPVTVHVRLLFGVYSDKQIPLTVLPYKSQQEEDLFVRLSLIFCDIRLK